MANQFIGRRVSVGLGIESVLGTSVAPAAWIRQLKFNLQDKTEVVENESALGRVEGISDSEIVKRWSEGSLEGKVNDITIGYLLKAFGGALVTTDNADSNPVVKDHTVDIANSNTPTGLTIVRKDGLTNKRFAMGTIDQLDFMCESGDWVKFAAQLKAKIGATGTDTPAYVTENEFTSKHVTAKLATNVAGLSGASALAAKSFKLTLDRPSSHYFAFGSTDPNDVTTGTVKVTGEIVLQYTATTYEALWAANTTQALSIAISNTDVTIGAAARPSLTFTMPKVKLRPFTMSDDLDEVVEQTVGFTAELDLSAGYMIRAVLVNTQASY